MQDEGVSGEKCVPRGRREEARLEEGEENMFEVNLRTEGVGGGGGAKGAGA